MSIVLFVINLENLKNLNYHVFLKNIRSFAVIVVINIKIFKEEESIEILKILGLITNIEEYQKIYNHD